MKQILTQSEWDEITDIYEKGLSEEIQSGDSSHIEDHVKIATILKYFPSLRSGIARKSAEDSWTISMGGEILRMSNNEFQGLLDGMLFMPGQFLVVPDNYTTPENADIDAPISIYAGPAATMVEIRTIANTLADVNDAIPEILSRLEALENPGGEV